MLDLGYLRDNLDTVETAMRNRGMDVPLGRFRELDESRRQLLVEVEQLKRTRNESSKRIGQGRGRDVLAPVGRGRAGWPMDRTYDLAGLQDSGFPPPLAGCTLFRLGARLNWR